MRANIPLFFLIMRQHIDLRTLIEQCTGYLRDAGFCEKSVVEFNRYMRCGLLAYSEEKGITNYSTVLGNEYLNISNKRNALVREERKLYSRFIRLLCVVLLPLKDHLATSLMTSL